MSEIILPHRWTPRSYQVPLWRYMEGSQEGKRAVAVWHRRAGKDLMGINIIASKIPERVGLYWHLLPTYKQGRAIVWNGTTRDGRPFLDHFPEELVTSKNSTEMRITFYNNAYYQVVGTDDINSLVGTNPIGCIFSEYSLHDPGAWEFIRPILAENGGWALFIYTARGRNHGYRLLTMAQKNEKWFSQVLTAGDGPTATKRPDGTPVISDEIIEEERKSGMPEEMIQQEFFCSFESPFVGAYYGGQMLAAERDKRIMDHISVDPRIPVDTYWDLGMNDATAIWFIQTTSFDVRVVDYYEANGEGLAHFAKLLRGQVDNHERFGSYLYGRHHAPWDIVVRELGTGKSRLETARSLGIKFVVGKQLDVDDGIEAVRNLIPQCYFDGTRCARGIEALRQYRKEWDEKNKVFRGHPLHDWTSNGADAFRNFATSKRERPRNSGPRQERAVDEFAYV